MFPDRKPCAEPVLIRLSEGEVVGCGSGVCSDRKQCEKLGQFRLSESKVLGNCAESFRALGQSRISYDELTGTCGGTFSGCCSSSIVMYGSSKGDHAEKSSTFESSWVIRFSKAATGAFIDSSSSDGGEGGDVSNVEVLRALFLVKAAG